MRSPSFSWISLAVLCLSCIASVAMAEPVVARPVLVRQQTDGPTGLPAIGLPSSTNSASSAGETPILLFTTNPNVPFTTCEPADISWTFGGPAESITLSVTNVNVTQIDPPTSSVFTGGGRNTFTNNNVRRSVAGIPVGISVTTVVSELPSGPNENDPPILLETLSTSVSPPSELFTWSKVNVPQGWYMIIATATSPGTAEYENFAARSRAFFVSNGTDMSCLITGSSPPSTSSSASGGNGGSSQTSGTSATPSTPIGASSSSNTVNKGALAGGIVGGLALVSFLIVGFLFYRTKHTNRLGSTASVGPDGNGYGGSVSGGPGSASRGLGVLGLGKWGDTSIGAAATGGVLAANTASGSNRKNSSRPGTGNSSSSSGGRKRSLSNSNSFTSSGFGIGLAALGFAPSQKKGGSKKHHQNPYTATAKKDRWKTRESSGSVGPMLTSSFSSTGHQSRHSQSQLGSYAYGNYSLGGTEEEYGVYTSTASPLSPYEEKEKGIPMSPIHSPVSSMDYAGRSPFSDPNPEDNIGGSSSPSTRSSTPSASRTSSRRSLPRVTANSSAQPTPVGAVIGNTFSESSSSVNHGDRLARTRAQSTPLAPPRSSHRTSSQTSSPISSHLASAQTSLAGSRPQFSDRHSSTQMHPSHILDVPQTPRTDSLRESYGSRRVSSPDYAVAYNRAYGGIGGGHPSRDAAASPPLGETSTSTPGSTSRRKTPRKPVPSYNPDDPIFAEYTSSTSPPQSSQMIPKSHSHSHSQPYSPHHGPTQSSASATSSSNIRNSNAQPTSSSSTQPRSHSQSQTNPNPIPSNNSSSSIVNSRKLPTLEHKDSLASLKSLRELGGGGKPMHVLIPDMPMEQQQQQGR